LLKGLVKDKEVQKGLGGKNWVGNVMRERLGHVELDGCKIGKLVLNKLSVVMEKAGSLANFRNDRSELAKYPNL
jgi:hypothetical protein